MVSAVTGLVEPDGDVRIYAQDGPITGPNGETAAWRQTGGSGPIAIDDVFIESGHIRVICSSFTTDQTSLEYLGGGTPFVDRYGSELQPGTWTPPYP